MTTAGTRSADALRAANLAFGTRYATDVTRRQPVHAVYGGAQLFRQDTARRLGDIALRALHDYAPNAAALGDVLGIGDHPALETIYTRVVEKLKREPVEDYRVDFEDGYGSRSDAEEDGHATTVADVLAAGMEAGSLPPFVGIRIKPLDEEFRARSVRTLEIVLTELVSRAGSVPHNFVVTVPKIVIVEQVEFLVAELARLERVLSLSDGAVKLEIMVETPQIIMAEDGRSLLPRVLEAARGRLRGAHFGTYDYTAALNITAAHQGMRHPACDFAKSVMQVSLAGSGVWLSDGATTVLPVTIHRARAGDILSAQQDDENCASVHAAWKLHFDDITHSLAGGFYQGWDLHPAQLVTRYAALYAFFLAGIDAAGARLRHFVSRAAQATLVGSVFDDAATGQGLLNFFRRGVNAGAITEEEVARMTGLSADKLWARTFDDT